MASPQTVASTETPRFERFCDLYPELRSRIYEYTFGANTEQGDLELTFPQDFQADGRISTSQFAGFNFLEATARSKEWREEHVIATRMAWSSVTLHIDISGPTHTDCADSCYPSHSRLLSKIVAKYPVQLITHLRLDSVIHLMYLILNPSLLRGGGGDKLKEYPRRIGWWKLFVNVETIEVTCNHPMLPSGHNDAAVVAVFRDMLERVKYMGHMIYGINYFGSYLRHNVPKIKHIILKNDRKSYVVGFGDREASGQTPIILKRVEVTESRVEEDDETDELSDDDLMGTDGESTD